MRLSNPVDLKGPGGRNGDYCGLSGLKVGFSGGCSVPDQDFYTLSG
jgi:hypothetical protein